MRLPRPILLLGPPAGAVALVLLACGGAPTPPAPGDPPPGDYGLAQRVLVQGLTFPVSPASPTPVQRVRAFPSLAFANPVALVTPPDGTDRIVVVEQSGRVLVFPNDDAVTSATVFLDITSRVSRAGSEEGLLGIAFSPDYASSGEFYLHYSAANPRRSVFSRFRVTADPDLADPASEEPILVVDQPYSNHNGGWLDFGPDGMLYIALGDGGSGGDPHGHGQDRTTLLGSILRIDPRGGEPYAIPPDNPFVGAGGGVRGEIWAYGLRNPWRCSFDRNTGDLWGGDVGQGAREEVDLIPRAGNLGWNIFEGTLPYANPQGLPATSFVAPVVDYPRTDGTVAIGGVVYRGTAVASLRGAYLHGDYGSGTVWALVRSGGVVTSRLAVVTVPGIVSFGEDRQAEVYAVAHGGQIYRFSDPVPGLPSFPPLLSETGLFTDLDTLEPAPGLVEYEVASALWSDGALKRRWIALPGTSTIGFHPTEAWTFPLGTILVKHFELILASGAPRRVETRVLVNETDGWAGYAYRWNDAQDDAELLAGSATDSFVVADPSAPGGTRTLDWTIPSRTDCLRCHTQAAGRILGVRTAQLNRDFDYPARRDNQLRAWNHIGLFSTDIGDASSYAALADPADPGVPQDARARSYLDANCANCHRPGGPTPVDIDLRASVPLGSMNLLGRRPTSGGLGLPDPWRLLSGSKESSVLWERMRRLDATRMPPLASHLADPLAVDLVGDWIDAGP